MKYREAGRSLIQSVGFFVEDVDGDEKMEIIVPTFKDSLEAHLDIYAYNFENQRFERSP